MADFVLVHGGLQRWLGDRILVESVEAEAIDARLEITVAYRLAGGDEVTVERMSSVS